MTEDYRKEKSEQLIEKYKDLIDKTFEVVDQDKLKYEIEKSDSESEKKYLDKIKARRQALDEITVILDKIELLEKHSGEDTGEGEETTVTIKKHPTKRYANK
jgi:hypothetical protein